MCWIGHTRDKKKAMHDIKVYKVLKVYRLDENVLMSPRQQFQYTEGKTYTAKITPVPGHRRFGLIKVEFGLHCYSERCTFKREDWDIHLKKYSDVFAELTEHLPDWEMGAIHSYRKDLYYYPVVFECAIPKGTTYYDNRAGEIVSEALTIDKVTEL
jgi:hypothetical protein